MNKTSEKKLVKFLTLSMADFTVATIRGAGTAFGIIMMAKKLGVLPVSK